MKKGRIKNIILKSIAVIVSIMAITTGCMIDSQTWIPAIICGICISYLAVFAYANTWFESWWD